MGAKQCLTYSTRVDHHVLYTKFFISIKRTSLSGQIVNYDCQSVYEICLRSNELMEEGGLNVKEFVPGIDKLLVPRHFVELTNPQMTIGPKINRTGCWSIQLQ